MPVQVAWYDAPHVIVTFWSGDISTSDMDVLSEGVRALMKDAKAPLFLLADTTEVTRPFMNMGIIRSKLRGIMDDERVVWRIGYGVKLPIVNFLLDFISRSFSVNVRSFSSWENAQAFLQSLDTDLDFSHTPAPPVNSR